MAKSKFRRVLKWMFGVWLVLIVLLGAVAANVIWFKPFSVDIFFERVFLEFVLVNPELLTDLRILEPFGITYHNAKLSDESIEFDRKMIEKSKRDLATLHRYDRASLTPDKQLSYDILEWYLDDGARAEPFILHDYPVNQMFGVQNDLPTFMAMKHQIQTEHDANQYLTRLGKVEEKFDQVIDGLKQRESKGIIPPKFVLAKVLEEMKGFTGNPKENILYTSFCEKLAKTPDIRAEEKEALGARVETAITEHVYPAYEKLAAQLRALDAKATTDDGVWKFPDGDAYYAYALRSQTTSDLTPEEVHEIGLAEVARITGEMQGILTGIGRTGKPVGALMADLAKDASFQYPNTDDGRADAIAEYQKIIDEIDKGLGDAFDLRPKVGVEVRRIPEFREQGSAGAYYESPSLDGTRPGVFFANLRDMSEVNKWGMRTLAYHEAIPGHHFQIAIQQQIAGPTFRKVLPFTSYMEGWALYAEQLAWELGFQEEPTSNLGRLQAELFRAVRLVVDTGIHYKRWTRERAIAYMTENTGMGDTEVSAEIERYIVMPGQACAYKIGMMKILECREKAKQELGDEFALKDFHNVLLNSGAMPLEVMEKQVDRYIAAKKSGAATSSSS